MRAIQIDRWLLNHVFARRRIFTIRLADCIDELGHSFGPGGDHFFVRALDRGLEQDVVVAELRKYYEKNHMPSMNSLLGRDIGPVGNCYFLPWEDGRIRPLSRFERSHKAGPTPEEALKPIAIRFLNILQSIKDKGFRPAFRVDGCPRVIMLENSKGSRKYIVRDGNHRMAALSYLGYDEVRVCFERDHWIPSTMFRVLYKIFRNRNANFQPSMPRFVREADVRDWPHVRSGLLTEEDALTVFSALYGRCFQSDSRVK